MGEWKPIRLAALGDIVTGKTPSKDNPEDWGDEMPFVTPTDYSSYGKYAGNSERKLSKSGIERLRKKVVPPGSILVTCIGSDMGKSVINRVPVITNQQINSISIANEEIDPDFIYYSMVGMEDELKNLGSSGSAVPLLNKGDFEQIEVNCPDLPEQRAIASVLSSLDAKIDLLHRQNKTLEGMAEALFRQWFVEEADEGWEEVELGRFVDCVNGVSYKSSELNPSKTALVTLKNFARDGGFRLDGFKEFDGAYKPQHEVFAGDLVVAHTDITQDASLIGNPVLVVPRAKYDKLVISMDLVKVVPKEAWCSKVFLYHLMRNSAFKEHAVGYSNGSTVLHLSKKAIPDFEFMLPPQQKVVRFTEMADGLHRKRNLNIVTIDNLTALRDTLLPKLMSGEVRVENPS